MDKITNPFFLSPWTVKYYINFIHFFFMIILTRSWLEPLKDIIILHLVCIKYTLGVKKTIFLDLIIFAIRSCWTHPRV